MKLARRVKIGILTSCHRNRQIVIKRTATGNIMPTTRVTPQAAVVGSKRFYPKYNDISLIPLCRKIAHFCISMIILSALFYRKILFLQKIIYKNVRNVLKH
jgi:hypothetical protein